LEPANIAGGIAALSTSDKQTLNSLFGHPIARNLAWKDAIGLFARLGSVEHMANNETSIRIGDEHQLLRRPHGKDLTIDELMALRHFLVRSGWSIETPRAAAETSDILIAIDHHEARVYHMDLRPNDPTEQVIKPYDPHHFLHHLTHKDQTRQSGERAAEDPSFYERIAQALSSTAPDGRIVIVGHGKGHSDAAHHLQEWLLLHHKETAQRVATAMAADISALTLPQLLALGRTALAPPA
jgi:hypothetical protein